MPTICVCLPVKTATTENRPIIKLTGFLLCVFVLQWVFELMLLKGIVCNEKKRSITYYICFKTLVTPWI